MSQHRVLVCGGRRFYDRRLVFMRLDGFHDQQTIDVLIHGDASGVDGLAGDWARARGVPVVPFPISREEWRLYGRPAGPRRNARMLREGHPTLVVAFPGGSGTEDMCKQARAAGVEVVRVRADGSLRNGYRRLNLTEKPC